MEHPLPEIYISQKLADTQHEVEKNKLIAEATKVKNPLQGWAAKRMHNLSIWMMDTGERLHERYHAPTCLPHLHQRSSHAR